MPPAGLPVTVDEARDACQSLYSGDDARLLQLIHAAVAHLDGADGVLGRAIMPQQWTLRVENGGLLIDLPLPPLIAIVSIAGISTDYVSAPILGVPTVLGISPATIALPSGTAFSTFQVVYTCGYTVVPESLRLAILMLVRHWYDHPGVVEMGRTQIHVLPMAVESLLAPFKVQSV